MCKDDISVLWLSEVLCLSDTMRSLWSLAYHRRQWIIEVAFQFTAEYAVNAVWPKLETHIVA